MDRYTATILNTSKTDLFRFYQQAPDLNWIWEQLYLTNLQEIKELKDTEWTEFKLRAEEAMKIAELPDVDLLSEKWADYMLSKETEALFIFLYSLREEFQEKHLLIRNKEKLRNLQNLKEPVIFISPHWGAFYSIPLIMSSLEINLCPIANGEEDDHLKRILDTLINEHKQNIKGILSTKYPLKLLKEMVSCLKNKISLIIYPEYTFGNPPKYTTKYLGIDFPATQGVAKISKVQCVTIQPISLRRIPETSLFELEFYDPISDKDLDLNISELNNKIHSSLEKIINKDLSQWWYWEIFKKNMKETDT